MRPYRYQSGQQTGAVLRFGRAAQGRELRFIPGATPADTDVWIASIPFVDPQGDDNWYACQKTHGARFREYWHENRYDQSHPSGGGGHLNWDPVRHGANHIGYGFEWRYQGFHSTNVSEDPYQPPIKFTTKITDTQFAQSNVNAFSYVRGQHADSDNAGTQINPLTHLMIHYGRPVISRDAEFDDVWFGPFPKVDPHQYEMLTYGSVMFSNSLSSSMESVWSNQVQAAAVEICGYPEAVPGDFLVGMLPANHWTKPKGIKKIGIRLGLTHHCSPSEQITIWATPAQVHFTGRYTITLIWGLFFPRL